MTLLQALYEDSMRLQQFKQNHIIGKKWRTNSALVLVKTHTVAVSYKFVTREWS